MTLTKSPPCPGCKSSHAYEDRGLWNCPECGHEWSVGEGKDGEGKSGEEDSAAKIIRDSNGVELKDGDTITVIKDLKFQGGVVKMGTKVKNIRLIPDAGDGHDIDCKIPGIGPMGLKSEFVKKIAE